MSAPAVGRLSLLGWSLYPGLWLIQYRCLSFTLRLDSFCRTVTSHVPLFLHINYVWTYYSCHVKYRCYFPSEMLMQDGDLTLTVEKHNGAVAQTEEYFSLSLILKWLISMSTNSNLSTLSLLSVRQQTSLFLLFWLIVFILCLPSLGKCRNLSPWQNVECGQRSTLKPIELWGKEVIKTQNGETFTWQM